MFADIVYGKCHCNACLASIAYIQLGWGVWRYGTVAVVECVNGLIVWMVASSWRTIIPGFRHSAHITYAYEYMLGLCGMQKHALRDHTTCVPIIMAKWQNVNPRIKRAYFMIYLYAWPLFTRCSDACHNAYSLMQPPTCHISYMHVWCVADAPLWLMDRPQSCVV